MTLVTGLRLEPSVAARERRLRTLLGPESEGQPALQAVVADAQLLGSLELSGLSFTWADVRARGSEPPREISGLRAAQALPFDTPLARTALLAWHHAVTGQEGGFRQGERTRESAPPTAPAVFIEGRLRLLEEWFGMDSIRELSPVRSAALALARVMEILPFDDGNGRVSRLAASRLMVLGGLRPPILVKGDRHRLESAIARAFQLDTAPLAALLEEASYRCLDVMIRTLEPKQGAP